MSEDTGGKKSMADKNEADTISTQKDMNVQPINDSGAPSANAADIVPAAAGMNNEGGDKSNENDNTGEIVDSRVDAKIHQYW